MNLETMHYIDLRNSDIKIGRIYDLLYNEHVSTHGDKSVTRKRFMQRIEFAGWSVHKAIDTPHKGYGGNRRTLGIKDRWKSYKGEKCAYVTFWKRVRKQGQKKHIAILPGRNSICQTKN